MACFIILCIIGIFIFSGQGVFYLTMLVMLTNTIEYDEWQSGTNHAAITFTVRPFMVKLAGALQYGIVALTLIICGLYNATSAVGEVEVAIGMLDGNQTLYSVLAYLEEAGHDMLKISEYLATSSTTVEGLRAYANTLFTVNNSAILGLTATMCILPIVLFIIAWVVIKKKYIIDEDMYEKILNELKQRELNKG